MSHHTEHAKKRKQGGYLDEAEYQAQAQQRRDEEINAAHTKFTNILQDDSILVPCDLTQAALQNAADLSETDLQTALEGKFKADPQVLHPKLLHSVFFRSMDPYNSFDHKHWQTRCTILHLRFGMDNPAMVRGGAEYVAAVEEHMRSPETFTAREHYIEIYSQGLTDLPNWPASTKSKFVALVKQLDASFEAARLDPAHAAQQALALLGEPVTQENEVQGMLDAFEQLAAHVRKEFDEGDLAKKMSMLQLAKNS